MIRRPKKLEALLDLRSRAVEAAEMAVASRLRHTASAREILAQCQAQYEAGLTEASRLSEDGWESAWDLGYRRAHLETLRTRITRALNALDEASKEEDRARSLLVDAKREHKKLELWCDARAREVQQDDDRKERKATDELALRGARQS